MSRALLAVAGLMFVVGLANVAQAEGDAQTGVRGKIASINAEAKSFVVKPENAAEVTVSTNAETTFKVDGKDAKFEDLKVGMRCEAGVVGGVAKAVHAKTMATRPAGDGLRGEVVSVNVEAKTLVVKPKEGADVTVTTDAETKFKVNGKEATLADVKAGMRCEVSPKTGVAKIVVARTPEAPKH